MCPIHKRLSRITVSQIVPYSQCRCDTMPSIPPLLTLPSTPSINACNSRVLKYPPPSMLLLAGHLNQNHHQDFALLPALVCLVWSAGVCLFPPDNNQVPYSTHRSEMFSSTTLGLDLSAIVILYPWPPPKACRQPYGISSTTLLYLKRNDGVTRLERVIVPLHDRLLRCYIHPHQYHHRSPHVPHFVPAHDMLLAL